MCFEILNVSSVNFKACFRLFQDGLRWGEERNKQQQRRGWLSLLLSLLFPRLPVIRVLFPSGPQCFHLDQPVSAYNHYYILLVPDIPLFRYGTAFALLSITPAMSKWAQCFTSTNSFNYKLLLHIYFTTANKQTTYVRKGWLFAHYLLFLIALSVMQKNAYSVKWAHLLRVTFVIYRRTFPNSLFII